MADERRRQHLGEATSAALPALWAILADRGWSQARLASEVDTDGGKVARLLYGDRKPGRALSAKLRDIGVAVELWDEPLPDGWLPPHVASDSSRALGDASESTDNFKAVTPEDIAAARASRTSSG